jgi:HD-like signal output (HDOD) protein
MGSSFIVFLVFTVICLLALGGIMLLSSKHSQKKKVSAPSSKTKETTQSTAKTSVYVPPISEESLDYLKVYELPWKPHKERPQEYSPALTKLLKETEEISPLVTELTTQMNDPDAITPQSMGKLIASDQGLTSFILRRVNSPFYGLVQKCDNIFNAIVILGYNEIHRIVMEERITKTGIRPSKEQWLHANLTSHIASYLVKTSRVKVPLGTLITLGMLHDIAKDVLHQKMPLPYDSPPPPKDPREYLQWEIETYGVDHATFGGELARNWRIPEKMCQCIEQHHWPMFWPYREVGKLSPDIIHEITFLSIADVASKNFAQELNGTYIGDDYYSSIRKTPSMERILTQELLPDLKRIMKIGAGAEPE